jgi:hypothetical protein
MASQLLRRFVWASTSVAATTLASACAGDRFGLLAAADAGHLSAPVGVGDAPATGDDLSASSSTGATDLAAAAPVTVGDEPAPQSDASAYVEAGVDGRPAPSDASVRAVQLEASSADAVSIACDFNGTWASRLTIDVSWVPQGLMGAILAPGSGRIEQWILSTRVTNGQTVTDTVQVCGIALPDFSGTQIAGGEKYGIEFPQSTFDKGVLPTFAVSGSIAGFGPGANYTTTPSAVLLGLTLSNPTSDPWPSTVTTSVDSDQDGKPGITAHVVQASGYSDVIVDTVGDRGDELYVVLRQVTTVTANAVDCDSFAGTVTIPQIADSSEATKYAIDSHVIGCRLDGDGGDCYDVQAAFVDATQPVFSPSGNTSFTSVRVANGATCAMVRQTLQ